jgi:ABC-type antimicrobial peptide transport system permease subunit
MALGADADRVVRLLAASGVKLVLVGTVVGLVASLALARLLGDLLFGVETFDLLTFVAVPLVLGLTAVAAYLPARRAARLNPVTALRAERSRRCRGVFRDRPRAVAACKCAASLT